MFDPTDEELRERCARIDEIGLWMGSDVMTVIRALPEKLAQIAELKRQVSMRKNAADGRIFGLEKQRAELETQLGAALEAIEKAPHAYTCKDGNYQYIGSPERLPGNRTVQGLTRGTCDCWKSAALSALSPQKEP